jgi:2'-5' RNA ligase
MWMSPLPTRLSAHWWQRAGRRPGRLQYHWHILFRDQPSVHELAAAAQRKLADLPGLDLVPLQWLHLTTLVLGFADEVAQAAVDTMVTTAQQLLASTEPIPVRLGRVFYHAEAVVLLVEPVDALGPVLSAVEVAAREAGCHGHADTDPWRPHISIAYSNGIGPAAPAIGALGLRVPRTEITIRSVSLVAQAQVGHSWQWQPVAEVPLGTESSTGWSCVKMLG